MQFDKIEFVVEPVMYPGKFAARVVAWHRGICVYEKAVVSDVSFRATMDELEAELRITASMVSRGKLVADPLELPPTTRTA